MGVLSFVWPRRHVEKNEQLGSIVYICLCARFEPLLKPGASGGFSVLIRQVFKLDPVMCEWLSAFLKYHEDADGMVSLFPQRPCVSVTGPRTELLLAEVLVMTMAMERKKHCGSS
jgi:hypothetical protein